LQAVQADDKREKKTTKMGGERKEKSLSGSRGRREMGRVFNKKHKRKHSNDEYVQSKDSCRGDARRNSEGKRGPAWEF